MKRLSLFFSFLVTSSLVAISQDDVTLYAKEVKPEETPEAIKEAIKSDFPDNAEQIMYYMFPENMVDSEWGVALNEGLATGDGEHYTVKMKGKKGGYVYGLYNKNGELEVLKMEAVDFALPPEIAAAATSGEYEGYHIKSNKYKCYKVVNKKTNKEYIQVQIAKDDDVKTLYFTPDGELIKEKG